MSYVSRHRQIQLMMLALLLFECDLKLHVAVPMSAADTALAAGLGQLLPTSMQYSRS
jgi:hypothetical protein